MSPAGAFAKFPAQVSLPVVPQYLPAFRKTIFTYLSLSDLVGILKEKNELISARSFKFGCYFRVIFPNFDVHE